QPEEQPEQTEESVQETNPGPSLVISFESNDDGTVSDIPGEDEGSENPGEDTDPDSEEITEDPDEEEEELPQVSIATDLGDKTLTTSQLQNDILNFYAYIENGTEDMYLTVYYTDPDGRQKIVSGSGNSFAQALRLGVNQFTLVLKQGGQILAQATYRVRYQAEKATEDNPEVGPNPPTITTNLDGRTEPTNVQEFLLQVTAADYHGTPLSADHISVQVDGAAVRNPTGGATKEYNLWLPEPVDGDQVVHHITVMAWDDEGNSAVKAYDLVLEFLDEGAVLGKATIIIDATSVGLGILDWIDDVDIVKGEYVSDMLLRGLEEYGYAADFDRGYLRSISRTDLAAGAGPDSTLMEYITRDGLTLTGQHSSDTLSEFDFTSGSGWMFSVNGGYPGRGLSQTTLEDGDVVRLIFTVAYGKDIGGAGATGGSYGSLQRYCGTWMDGTFYEHHAAFDENDCCSVCGKLNPNHVHEYTFETLREPTCSEPGLQHGVCACGDETDEPIETAEHSFADGRCTECGAIDPNHEHTFTEVQHEEPTCTQAGIIREECACGETQEEILPAAGHQFNERFRCTVCGELDPDHEHSFQPEELSEQDYEIVLAPTCTTPGRKIPVCPHCGERGDKAIYSEYWVEIPVRDHSYADGICTMCGQPDPNYVPPDPGGTEESGEGEEGGDGE
ncbi:MAG: DUF4430 domain-containing protein, partial [Clostridia bacterium]|nr:DUF4430 domain-containing protein [Clostridia bacterium]